MILTVSDFEKMPLDQLKQAITLGFRGKEHANLLFAYGKRMKIINPRKGDHIIYMAKCELNNLSKIHKPPGRPKKSYIKMGRPMGRPKSRVPVPPKELL